MTCFMSVFKQPSREQSLTTIENSAYRVLISDRRKSPYFCRSSNGRKGHEVEYLLIFLPGRCLFWNVEFSFHCLFLSGVAMDITRPFK